MILVDTTVWIDHLRRGDQTLVQLLDHLQVSTHPFVVGEIACGHIKNRRMVLTAMARLPALPVHKHSQVLEFLENNKLVGLGLGWIDVHLLVAAEKAGERLFTRDRRLKAAAQTLGLA